MKIWQENVYAMTNYKLFCFIQRAWKQRCFKVLARIVALYEYRYKTILRVEDMYRKTGV